MFFALVNVHYVVARNVFYTDWDRDDVWTLSGGGGWVGGQWEGGGGNVWENIQRKYYHPHSHYVSISITPTHVKGHTHTHTRVHLFQTQLCFAYGYGRLGRYKFLRPKMPFFSYKFLCFVWFFFFFFWSFVLWLWCSLCFPEYFFSNYLFSSTAE